MPHAFRKLLLPVVIVLTIILGYLSLGTSFDSNVQHINYMTPEQQENLKLLFTSVQSNDSLTSVFAVSKGENLDDALHANERLQALIDDVPHVHKVYGINGLVPSSERLHDRMDKWTAFWERHSDVIDHTKQEAERLGFSSVAFSPFFDLCEGKVQDLDSQNPLLDLIGRNYILHNADGSVRIVNILQIEKNQVDAVKQLLRTDIEEKSMDAFVFDSTDVSSSLVTVLSDSFNYIGFVCGFVVFAFLWLSFGRLELSIISFLPLAVSWLWILGFMDIFSIQFNIVNIILATFIFGQGDDYSIFITEG